MKHTIDKDGVWEVRGLVRLLVEPSTEFQERRRLQAVEFEKAESERALVQAERDGCIAYLKTQANLGNVDLAGQGFKEAALEMSFEDIIESVGVNREAELREI